MNVSSEEVERGKPAPTCTCAQLMRWPSIHRVRRDRGFEQRSRAAAAAGMAVVAVPNAHYPPARDALSLAAATVATVGEITPELIEQVA